MAEKFGNFIATTLAANAAISDLTIEVASATGAPALGAGDFFRLTLIRASDSAKEIVYVTNVSGTTWTVTRAQESTSALTLLSGDAVRHVVTAGMLNGLLVRDTITMGTPTGTGTSKSVTMTVSRAAYFNIRWRLIDSATPSNTATFVPPTGSSVVEATQMTNGSGVLTLTFTHNGANRDWYLQADLNGEAYVSAAINLG